MPLQEIHKNHITAGIEFLFADLPNTLIALKQRAKQLETIFNDAFTSANNGKPRERKPRENPDDYLIYLCAAAPERQFKNLEKADKVSLITVIEVQSFILNYAINALTLAAARLPAPLSAAKLGWDTVKTTEFLNAFASEQNYLFNSSFDQQDFGAGEYSWELTTRKDLQYSARIYFMPDEHQARFISLAVEVKLTNKKIWIFDIPEFFYIQERLGLDEQIEFQQRVKKLALLRAEDEALIIITKQFEPAKTRTLSKEVRLLLLNHYYFGLLSKQPELLDQIEKISRFQALWLCQPEFVLLITKKFLEIKQILGVSKSHASLIKIPFYNGILIENKEFLTAILQLTSEQAFIMTFPAMVNLQKEKALDFTEAARTLNLITATIISNRFYYDLALKNAETLEQLFCQDEQEKNNLLASNVIDIISGNFLSIADAKRLSPHALAIISNNDFFPFIHSKALVDRLLNLTEEEVNSLSAMSRYLQSALMTFEEILLLTSEKRHIFSNNHIFYLLKNQLLPKETLAQFSEPYDLINKIDKEPSLLIFFRASKNNFEQSKINDFIEATNDFYQRLKSVIIVSDPPVTGLPPAHFLALAKLKDEVEKAALVLQFSAADWISILTKKILLALSDKLENYKLIDTSPDNLQQISSIILIAKKFESDATSLYDIRERWLEVLSLVRKWAQSGIPKPQQRCSALMCPPLSYLFPTPILPPTEVELLRLNILYATDCLNEFNSPQKVSMHRLQR